MRTAYPRWGLWGLPVVTAARLASASADPSRLQIAARVSFSLKTLLISGRLKFVSYAHGKEKVYGSIP
jgi:hypothetical protein